MVHFVILQVVETEAILVVIIMGRQGMKFWLILLVLRKLYKKR